MFHDWIPEVFNHDEGIFQSQSVYRLIIYIYADVYIASIFLIFCLIFYDHPMSLYEISMVWWSTPKRTVRNGADEARWNQSGGEPHATRQGGWFDVIGVSIVWPTVGLWYTLLILLVGIQMYTVCILYTLASGKLRCWPWFYHQFLMETSLPTPDDCQGLC